MILAVLFGCPPRYCPETDNELGPRVWVVDEDGENVRSALVSDRVGDGAYAACVAGETGWFCMNDDVATHLVRVESPGFEATETAVEVPSGPHGCDNETVPVTIPVGPSCASYAGPRASVMVLVDGGPVPDGMTLEWSFERGEFAACTPGDVASACGVDAVGALVVRLVRPGADDVVESVFVPMDGCDAVTQALDLASG
jgi:hypothetical protein